MLPFAELAVRAQHAIDDALAGWLEGRPRSELAYVNRLTAILSQAHLCNITTFSYPVWVTLRTYDLHQQAENSSDRFGADLAVTIIYEQASQTKTALFQVKRSKQDACVLEFRQLQDAATAHAILDRSFVFTVDEFTARTKITAVRNRLHTWPTGQRTHKVSTRHWARSVRWIAEWLACQHAPISAPKDGYPVEAELARHAIEPSYYTICI
jgi:hypothetical protein